MLFENSDPDLKLRLLWLAIGYGLIIFVVFLSLTSQPIDTGLSFVNIDKLYHALAYFVMMAWFSQIYHKPLQRNILAVIFVFMGVLLEYLQSFEPNRFAEWSDMAANTAGVALGFYLALTRARNCLLQIENGLKLRTGSN